MNSRIRDPKKEVRDWAVTLLAGSIVFGLYLTTLAPGVLGGDAGELQFVPSVLGIAHPSAQVDILGVPCDGAVLICEGEKHEKQFDRHEACEAGMVCDPVLWAAGALALDDHSKPYLWECTLVLPYRYADAHERFLSCVDALSAGLLVLAIFVYSLFQNICSVPVVLEGAKCLSGPGHCAGDPQNRGQTKQRNCSAGRPGIRANQRNVDQCGNHRVLF